MTPDARSRRGRRDPQARRATSTRRRSTRTESRYSTRSTEPAPEPTPTRKWFKRPLIVAPLAIVLVVGNCADGLVVSAAARSGAPKFSVRSRSVRNRSLSLLAVPTGQPLMRVDTGAAAARVATIPKVASARVQRMYPSTIRVTVTERVPVVFVDSPEGAHLLDAKGVDFEIGVAAAGGSASGDRDAGRGTTSRRLPRSRCCRCCRRICDFRWERLRARSISDVSLTLLDGRVVNWGGVEQLRAQGCRDASAVDPTGADVRRVQS